MHVKDALQADAAGHHATGHAINDLPLMFGHGTCVVTHHDLLGRVADAVHRLTDRAAGLHQQSRMGHPQRPERRGRASRDLTRPTEMVAQRLRRQDHAPLSLEHVRA